MIGVAHLVDEGVLPGERVPTGCGKTITFRRVAHRWKPVCQTCVKAALSEYRRDAVHDSDIITDYYERMVELSRLHNQMVDAFNHPGPARKGRINAEQSG